MITSDKFKLDFEYIDPYICNAWVATAIIGSAIVGAGASIWSANKAADAQTSAANSSIAAQQKQQAQTRADLATYRNLGETGSTQLTSQLSDLTKPVTMDQATLEATPGYQWNLTQGLKATQNAAAARGLGTSGAALKGAATFATGLADSTYQNQFNNAVTNQTNTYNRLMGLVNTGENAAAQTGNLGQQSANNISQSTMAIGNANAAADNKIGNSILGAANNLGGYAAYKGLYGSGGSSGGSGITYGTPDGPTPFI